MSRLDYHNTLLAWNHCYCVLILLNFFRVKRGPLFGLGRDRMASMATFRVPSKISFLLATVNQAPSPALRISNMVSYIHEEPWQSQLHSFADFAQRTIKWYVDIKTSPFFVRSDTDFFSVAVNVKHGFLSCETLTECTWLQHR